MRRRKGSRPDFPSSFENSRFQRGAFGRVLHDPPHPEREFQTPRRAISIVRPLRREYQYKEQLRKISVVKSTRRKREGSGAGLRLLRYLGNNPAPLFTKAMINEAEKIAELENEIRLGADLEAKLQRYVDREDAGEHRDLVQIELNNLTHRLDFAQAELAERYALRNYQMARERRKRPGGFRPTPPRPPVKLLGITQEATAA